jgi:hypothetical protein
MKGRLFLVALVAAAAFLFLRWPRINEVQTGKTTEYPDLVPLDARGSVPTVAKIVKGTLAHLPGWRLVGEGTGPAGASIQALHRTPPFGFEEDVTIQVRPEGGRTRVSVRSKSRSLDWDFGQNARNIRELLAAVRASL